MFLFFFFGLGFFSFFINSCHKNKNSCCYRVQLDTISVVIEEVDSSYVLSNDDRERYNSHYFCLEREDSLLYSDVVFHLLGYYNHDYYEEDCDDFFGLLNLGLYTTQATEPSRPQMFVSYVQIFSDKDYNADYLAGTDLAPLFEISSSRSLHTHRLSNVRDEIWEQEEPDTYFHLVEAPVRTEVHDFKIVLCLKNQSPIYTEVKNIKITTKNN